MYLTKNRGCHSPERPPEAKQDKLICSTCHRRFKSEKANDLHELCKAANINTPAQKSRQKQINVTLVIAAKFRQRDIRISTMASDMFTIYRAALRKPNTDGTYNVNGKVMSMQDIKR